MGGKGLASPLRSNLYSTQLEKLQWMPFPLEGQEKGSSPNTGRVQILWRRKHPLPNPTEPSGNSTANFRSRKKQQTETKQKFSSADARTWTVATSPQLKSSNSSTRSSARKTTKSRAMARVNPPGFSCASGNRNFQEKKALFSQIYTRRFER